VHQVAEIIGELGSDLKKFWAIFAVFLGCFVRLKNGQKGVDERVCERRFYEFLEEPFASRGEKISNQKNKNEDR
jgi:hypothetical protein